MLRLPSNFYHYADMTVPIKLQYFAGFGVWPHALLSVEYCSEGLALVTYPCSVYMFTILYLVSVTLAGPTPYPRVIYRLSLLYVPLP